MWKKNIRFIFSCLQQSSVTTTTKKTIEMNNTKHTFHPAVTTRNNKSLTSSEWLGLIHCKGSIDVISGMKTYALHTHTANALSNALSKTVVKTNANLNKYTWKPTMLNIFWSEFIIKNSFARFHKSDDHMSYGKYNKKKMKERMRREKFEFVLISFYSHVYYVFVRGIYNCIYVQPNEMYSLRLQKLNL